MHSPYCAGPVIGHSNCGQPAAWAPYSRALVAMHDISAGQSQSPALSGVNNGSSSGWMMQ